jgi:DNA-binding MarR family transcriptional regulator
MNLQRYLEVVSLIEHVHSKYHRLLKEELGQIGSIGISSVQAAVLFQIGDSKRSINEVRNRTNYIGSDINFIIQKLINNGYLFRERSQYDHRVVNVWLSEEGRALRAALSAMQDRHIRTFFKTGAAPDFERTLWTLRQIEQFLIDRQLDRPDSER